jgi:hypothetical protein
MKCKACGAHRPEDCICGLDASEIAENDPSRALLALLDFEESVKETNLGRVLGHLQAQITELQGTAHRHVSAPKRRGGGEVEIVPLSENGIKARLDAVENTPVIGLGGKPSPKDKGE